MRKRRVLTTVALFGLVGSAGCGGGGGGSASPTTPTTPSTPSAPTQQLTVSADLPSTPNPPMPGLYQDGMGTYPPGDDVYFDPSLHIFIRPLCPGSSQTTPRALNLVLPSTAVALVAARLSRCMDLAGAARTEAIFLHLPNPSYQQVAVLAPRGAPLNADTSQSIFLFFNVDSNGDGKIEVPPDEQYNIRWQQGMYIKRRSETATTIISELTALATEFGPDLSCSAELILRNTPLGEISKGFSCIPLVVTVTVQK